MSSRNRVHTLSKHGVNLPATSASGARLNYPSGGLGRGMLVQVGIDYTVAPIPSQAYFADYVSVGLHRTGVMLVFGKLNGSGSGLRTQIEIVFPKLNFNAQLWSSAAPLRDTLRQLDGVTSDMTRPELPDAEKVQTLTANNVFMATTPEEALLDFYYLSPRGVFLATSKQSTDVTDLQAVIRVSSDASLLREFMERCEPYVEGNHPNVQV